MEQIISDITFGAKIIFSSIYSEYNWIFQSLTHSANLASLLNYTFRLNSNIALNHKISKSFII